MILVSSSFQDHISLLTLQQRQSKQKQLQYGAIQVIRDTICRGREGTKCHMMLRYFKKDSFNALGRKKSCLTVM
jgi:hypothetical protein